MEDRERISRLVGRKVAVRLTSVEARGMELIATLDEVREDGLVLSEIGEIGPGPTMFCPWDSLWRVRERSPWLAPPHEEPDPGEWESHEFREAPVGETESGPLVEHHRKTSAENLERVVPVAQKQTVGGTTVALLALALYGEGLGLLRWQISLEDSALRRNPDLGFGIPEPEFEIRDGSGRELPWSPQGSGASDGEADGDVRVEGLPDAGELEIRVPRLVADAYEDGEYRGIGPSYEGPWTFRFSMGFG